MVRVEMRRTVRRCAAFCLTIVQLAGIATAQDEWRPASLLDVEQTSAETTEAPAAENLYCPPAPAAVSPFAGSLCERPYLIGNLGGVRDSLAADGVMVDVSSTQFYQGVAAGGVRRNFEYSGRMDYFVNIDGEKAGLWKGFFVTLHGETRYGDTVNFDTGAIMPVNTSMLFPLPTGELTALTAVKFTQALSDNFITFAGKINLVDELKQPFAAGRGVDAFMNLGLAFPVTAARTVPYSTLGGGFVILKDMQPIVTFMVLDTNNTPTTSGFESFFDNGASMIGRIDIPVAVRGLPGHHGFWGTLSTGNYGNLSPTAYFDPNVGVVLVTGRDNGSAAVFYSADQALFVDPANPKRSWGLFTNLGLADDGPSPIRFSANVGLGGSSPIATRPLDTFGIGYAFTGYSTPVQQFAPVLLPVGDDHVVELFYNYAVTPWFRLTPDLQILVPARERTLPPGAESIDTALVLGLRAKIDF